MAITAAICDSWKQEILQGIHLAADTFTIALYTSSATLNKTTTAYSASNEVSAAGYVAGGIALVGFTVSISGDTAYIDWSTDPSWAAASITARGALIYNASRSNKSVCVLDFGSDIVSTNGTFTVQLPAPGLTAVIRIT